MHINFFLHILHIQHIFEHILHIFLPILHIFLHVLHISCIFPAYFAIFCPILHISCIFFAYFLAFSAYSLSYFAFLVQNMPTFVHLSGVSRSFNQVQWVLQKLEEQSRAVPKLGPAQSEISMSLSSCAALGGRLEAGVL